MALRSRTRDSAACAARIMWVRTLSSPEIMPFRARRALAMASTPSGRLNKVASMSADESWPESRISPDTSPMAWVRSCRVAISARFSARCEPAAPSPSIMAATRGRSLSHCEAATRSASASRASTSSCAMAVVTRPACSAISGRSFSAPAATAV